MRPVSTFALALTLMVSSLSYAQSVSPTGSDAATPTTANAAIDTAATTKSAATSTTPICGIEHLVRCVEDLGEDDKGILTSPLHIQPKDAYWLAPIGIATGVAIQYDGAAQQQLGVDQSRMDTANNISMIGEFWIAGGESAAIYFAGLAKKDPKLAETGRLAAEAIIDSGTVTLVVKLSTNRERPYQGNGNGDFWQTPSSGWSWDSSFPSGHATASMALARVVAGEYPKWYIAGSAYGLAETVSICRVLGRDHFPSDVIVGQTIGFLAGSYVLNHRALYRPGKKGAVARMLHTVTPVMDPVTQSYGASIRIPMGQ